MKGLQTKNLLVAVLFSIAAVPAHAAVIKTDTSSPDDIPGLTGFATSGDEMVGMEVTATIGLVSETLSWTATGSGSGGVFGDGWSLTQSGDTFGALSWTFSLAADSNPLTRLQLNGIPGLTVFDKTDPNTGTSGSAQGKDFATNLSGDALVEATYSDPVGVAGADPVGDLFHTLTIDFTGLDGGGVRSGFLMTQDTDNDSRLTQVPLPGTLALLALGLLGLGAASRRRG